MNKKGRRILSVEISKGIVTAFDEDGNIFKLTRQQRNLFKNFDGNVEALGFAFNNMDILATHFRIVRDGDIVYQN